MYTYFTDRVFPGYDGRAASNLPRALVGVMRGGLQLQRRVADAELLGAQLSGKINEAAKSAEFRLRGQLRATKAGARLPLLSGAAAPSDKTAGDGWHLELAPADSAFRGYELVTEREGSLAVELAFAAVFAALLLARVPGWVRAARRGRIQPCVTVIDAPSTKIERPIVCGVQP